MREIDITKQDIRCCDDFYVEYDWVNIPYELWFEVDKYFGTNTNDDNSWVNFYTFYHKDGNVTAVYEVDTDDGNESFDWKLTDIEKAFFRQMMDDYCHNKCGCTLEQLLMEVY